MACNCNSSQNSCSCESNCFVDNRPDCCNGEPVCPMNPEPRDDRRLELCCDSSGCCGLYPKKCRNPFWPSFAKPSWLCCHDLYNR